MEEIGVKIFDVTLSEGEQTPELSFNPRKKVQLANRMVKVEICHIEIDLVGVVEDEALTR
jgi:isopropylmalate/homocitrate/citramalate synthase